MTDITKCYTRAAGTFVIATFDPRTIVSYFIVSSFLKSRHEPLRHRHFCMANRRISENRKSRFAIMLARSMKTGLFDIVERSTMSQVSERMHPGGWPRIWPYDRLYRRIIEAWWVLVGYHSLHGAWQKGYDQHIMDESKRRAAGGR